MISGRKSIENTKHETTIKQSTFKNTFVIKKCKSLNGDVGMFRES